MSKQKKLLGVSDLNLNIKPYQEEHPKQEVKQESSGFQPKGDGWDWFFKPTITGDATLEALKEPGRLFNKGVSQLDDNPLAGALNIGQGLVGIPFLLATVPLAFGEDFLKSSDKLVGTTDKKGDAKGVGNFISEGLNGVFQTPAMIYDLGKKGVDLGLTQMGIDPDGVDEKIKQGMIATRLMPKDATEQQFKETQEALDEAGKLGATILGFEGIKLAKNKIAPKVDKVNVIPKGEAPQDIKQTEPKQLTGSQRRSDFLNRKEDITPKEPNTAEMQAYTKMELFKDELSTKKDKLLSDIKILQKQAFDKKLTPEQRIEAKNKLKEVKTELDGVSEQLTKVKDTLAKNKQDVKAQQKFTLGGKEQKLLTEGTKESIPTENVPSNINFTLPKEKQVEIGKETGLKGLPIEKESKLPVVDEIQGKSKEIGTDIKIGETKEIKTPEDFRNATTPEITNFVKKEIGVKEYDKIVEEAANRPENKIPVEGKNKAGQDITEVDMQAAAIEDAVYAKAQEIIYEKNKPVETPKPEVTEVKTEQNIPKPQESTIERLKREALDEYKKNASQTNLGFNPLDYKANIKLGAYHIKNGIVKFADWSAQMVKDLGEKIKPQLLRIWNEVKKFGEDLGKIAVDKIGEFVDSKYNPARPLKMVDQSLFEKQKKETPPIRSFSEQNAKKLTEKEYDNYAKIEADKKTIKGRFKLFAADGVRYSKSLMGAYDKFVKSTDRQVESVAPRYFRKLTEHDFNTLGIVKQREGHYKDFVKTIADKFNDVDLAKLKLAMLNGDGVKLGELFSKYKIDEKPIRGVLNEIAKGSDLTTSDFYFPRGIKDYASFIKKFEGMESYNIFSRLINEKQKKFKEELTDVQKFSTIDNAVRGYNPGITLAKLGNEKNRVIKIIDESLAQDYYDPIAYLGRYIAEMTEMQEARKFFGKGKDGGAKSIGELILENVENEKLDWQKAQILKNALHDRFQSKITPPVISAIKKAFYLEKLAQIRASVTQLKDLSMSLYRTNPYETTRAMYDVIVGKKKAGLEDINLLERDIASEVMDLSRLTKVLDENMKWAGFSKFDAFGKETFINSYLNYYSKQAKLNSKKFNSRADRLFEGAEKQKVKNDLINKNLSNEVKLLLFSELVRTQPVSKSSLPAGYHQSSYGRLLYTARTFAARRFNFIIDEIKTSKTPIEKVRTATRLAVYMGLLGASVDVIESVITGNKLKPEDLDDTLIYNLMDNIGLNRYFVSKFGKDQFTEAVSGVLSKLPIPYVDNIYADIKRGVQGKPYKANMLKSVPVIGRLAHDQLIQEENNKPNRYTRR